MTQFALNLFRASSRQQQTRRPTAQKSPVKGVWHYRLLAWAFRNS